MFVELQGELVQELLCKNKPVFLWQVFSWTRFAPCLPETGGGSQGLRWEKENGTYVCEQVQEGRDSAPTALFAALQ